MLLSYYVMLKSQNAQSRDLSIAFTLYYNSYTPYQISPYFSKAKSLAYLIDTTPIKQNA